jgi:hypothetical protein
MHQKKIACSRIIPLLTKPPDIPIEGMPPASDTVPEQRLHHAGTNLFPAIASRGENAPFRLTLPDEARSNVRSPQYPRPISEAGPKRFII